MSDSSKARYSRILVKLSGEALLGAADYGIDPAVLKRIAGELQEIVADGRADRGRHRRRQHLPRRGPGARRHGPRGRRPHGHARHRDERARDAGCAGEPGHVRARHVGDPHQRGLRGLHPPPRDPPPGEGAGGDFRRRHRQSLLHHRHRRRAARDRDRRRCAAQGDQGERRLLRRSGAQSGRACATRS